MKCFIPLPPSGEPNSILEKNAFPTQIYNLSNHSSLRIQRANSSYLIFVIDGFVSLKYNDISFSLHEGMYAHVMEVLDMEFDGHILIIEQFNYSGLFSVGGPIENQGRLKYIDGCSDTLLISPDKMGAPCFNLLHIPPNTFQTQHTHPSYRLGVIVSGNGICKTPEKDITLYPGLVFCIPENCLHSFITTASALRVVAYHPDSDFGPTDENHPMINKTIIN